MGFGRGGHPGRSGSVAPRKFATVGRVLKGNLKGGGMRKPKGSIEPCLWF